MLKNQSLALFGPFFPNLNVARFPILLHFTVFPRIQFRAQIDSIPIAFSLNRESDRNLSQIPIPLHLSYRRRPSSDHGTLTRRRSDRRSCRPSLYLTPRRISTTTTPSSANAPSSRSLLYLDLSLVHLRAFCFYSI